MWIVVASTCSRSAPESAGLTSELSLQQAERLASSVTLSGKLSPPRSWLLAWKKRPWLRHLSGATCEPSTAGRGVELWIASLAATRANRSASPVSDVGRTIRGTFGRRSLESLRRLNPHSVSSRTSEGTYHSGSTLFGTSFKEWATELRLDFSRRQKLARRIGGSGSSYWGSLMMPTPNAVDGKGSARACLRTSKGRGPGNNLRDWFRQKYGMLYPPVAVVEYVMGLPIGFTDFTPMEMELSLWRRRMRSCLCGLVWRSEMAERK